LLHFKVLLNVAAFYANKLSVSKIMSYILANHILFSYKSVHLISFSMINFYYSNSTQTEV